MRRHAWRTDGVVVGVEQVDQQGDGVEAHGPQGGVVDDVALGTRRRQVEVGDVAAHREGRDRPALDAGEQRRLAGRHQHAVGPDGGHGVEHGGEVLDRREVGGNGEEAVVEGDDEAATGLGLQQTAQPRVGERGLDIDVRL